MSEVSYAELIQMNVFFFFFSNCVLCFFQTVVLEKILGSPLDSKENQPVNLKRHQPWIFIGSSDAEAEALKLWPSDVKSRLLGKDSNGRKDWGRKEKWGDRGWDGWMASLAQWTCVWVNSGRWWRTGKPGVLLSVGSQRVRHNWATEQRQCFSQRQAVTFYWKDPNTLWLSTVYLFGSFLVVRHACPASSSLLAQRHTWVLESGGLHFNPVSAKC